MDPAFKIDFIGIGAAKAGTTWLGHVLAEHPQICMSEPKEVHFFNDRIAFRHPIMKPNFTKGISWYKKYFLHCAPGKIKGEITPRYSIDTAAPQRIHEHNPDVKIFYCLRHPVDRIESHYNFSRYFVRKEDRTLDQAIREEPEYLDMSMYSTNLNRYLAFFPLEQFCFVWFEDIEKRPAEVLKSVYQFLGVEPDFEPPSMNKKSNPGRASRSIGFQFFTRRVMYLLIRFGFSGMIHKLKRTRIKDWVMRWNSKPFSKEKMSPDTKAFVIRHIQDDVRHLERVLKKDLSHWLQSP